MRRTIRSEYQYDAKLVAAANTKPKIRPCDPPRASPSKRNRPLSAPSSSVVLTALDIWISILHRRSAAPVRSQGGIFEKHDGFRVCRQRRSSVAPTGGT